jgi:hypothetical protein
MQVEKMEFTSGVRIFSSSRARLFPHPHCPFDANTGVSLTLTHPQGVLFTGDDKGDAAAPPPPPSAPTPARPPATSSAPPSIPTTNPGHILLSKQGWREGFWARCAGAGSHGAGGGGQAGRAGRGRWRCGRCCWAAGRARNPGLAGAGRARRWWSGWPPCSCSSQAGGSPPGGDRPGAGPRVGGRGGSRGAGRGRRRRRGRPRRRLPPPARVQPVAVRLDCPLGVGQGCRQWADMARPHRGA